MGRIYNALKKAEKEAKIIKERRLSHGKKITLPEIKKESAHIIPDRQKDKTKDVHELTEATKVTNLKLMTEGTVHKKRENKKFSFLNVLKKVGGDVTQGSLTNRNLFAIQEPNSLAAEQYRILRARILGFTKEKNMKTFLITSCLPGEGKSTVSSNLSICIANSINEHALLIDCDLRRPTIHKIFGLDNSSGLSNYLNEDIDLYQAMNKTEVEKLTIIPSGSTPNNPSELLSSNKMFDLIQEIKERYTDRYVIFDSTPIYQTSDPTTLAKHIDGIILVVKSGETNREIIAKMVEYLGKDKIMGIVFNMTQEPIRSYYYNYNYYYSSQ